jgi:hypothetical protein
MNLLFLLALAIPLAAWFFCSVLSGSNADML